MNTNMGSVVTPQGQTDDMRRKKHALMAKYKVGGKVQTVMHEYKHGKLHSGSKRGPLVQNRKQAIAIALSEQRKAMKEKYGDGGPVSSVPPDPVYPKHADMTERPTIWRAFTDPTSDARNRIAVGDPELKAIKHDLFLPPPKFDTGGPVQPVSAGPSKPMKPFSWWELLQQAIKELMPESPLRDTSSVLGTGMANQAAQQLQNRGTQIDRAVDQMSQRRGGRVKRK